MSEGIDLNEIVFDKDAHMADYRILDVNRAFYHVADFEPGQVLGNVATKLYSMSSDLIRTFLESHKLGNQLQHTEFVSPRNQRIYSISTSPIQDDKFVTSFTDITESKWSEEEIRTILGTTMDGFYLVDMEGRILDVNDSYCSMVGYRRKELLKMSIKDIEAVETEEETKKHIQQISKTGSDRFETKHKRKDGVVIDVEAAVNYLKGGQGKLFVFMRDVTERKQAEEELQSNISLLNATLNST